MTTLRPVDESVIISQTISHVTHACTRRLHIHTSVFFSCPYFLILPFTCTPTAFSLSHNSASNSRCNCIQHEGQSPITGQCKFKSACDKHAWSCNSDEQTTQGFTNLVFCTQNVEPVLISDFVAARDWMWKKKPVEKNHSHQRLENK